MVAHLYSYKERHLILQVEDRFGEIAPLPGWSKETFTEAKQELLDYLRDQKPPSLPSVQWGLFSLQFPMTAIQIPLCSLHEPKEQCATVKIKATTVSETIQRIKPWVGKYRVRLDCNRAWTLKQALDFCTHFSAEDFDYLEEPVQTKEELLQFSQLSAFPIALDETYRESGLLDIPTLKAVVIKPMLTGYLPSLPIPIILSSSYETSLGILQIAKHANMHLTHGLDTFSDDLLNPPLQIKEGCLIWNPSLNPIRLEKLCHIVTVP